MRIAATTLMFLVLAAPQISLAADGLQLGALAVRSALGQTFEATLTVEAGTPAALNTLQVRLADATIYSQRGLPRPPALDQLRFVVTPGANGAAQVRIDSAAGMREPTLMLLVEARSGGASTLREYTVLLDPPGKSNAMRNAAPSEPVGTAVAVGAVEAEVVWEFDAYYTSVGANLPLTDEPVPEGGDLSEWEVYRKLFRDSLHPRVLLLEASVYPMPVLGTYVREHSPNTYDSFTLGDSDLNLLQAVTAGFQEPWAVAAFIGSEINFSRAGERRKGTNKGYMGYLASAGTKHIKDNVLIDDDWWEFEWKLKGEREFKGEDLTWSFRTGVKNHGNQDIADIILLGARRSSLNLKADWLSWLNNSSFDLVLEFTQENLEFARADLVIGKKFPFKDRGFALSLEFGAIYEKDLKYLGVLADPTDNTLALVFRPNLEF